MDGIYRISTYFGPQNEDFWHLVVGFRNPRLRGTRIFGLPRPWRPEGVAAGEPTVPGGERGAVGERGGRAGGDHLAVNFRF